MAKFWPLHHYNQCMGENRRKTPRTARGRGGVSTWYFHQIQVGMWAKLWDMSHLFVCFVALVIQSGAMAKFWPLHHYNQCMGENGRKTPRTARGRGGVSTWYFHQIQVGMWAKLWDMSHLFVCFVALVIQSGAMAKFWPLHHYNQCMGENGRKTLNTARGRGGVSTWYFHQIQVGMWAKLWNMSHLFVCFVALVIQSGAMAKFWPLHHLVYNKCMGKNGRKTLSTAPGRGGVSTWYFHQIQVGMRAKLWDMSHLFVCFVALVIQSGAMAKFWPLHHYNQCMGENGRKTPRTARGRGGVSTWYFHQIQVGMWAKLWDMSHLFVCFVALVIQSGAMAKFWPLHHYNQCMGENRRKTLSTAHGRGGVSTWYFHQIQVGMWAKLWDMSHLFVCFVALVIQSGAMAKFWPLHHYNQCMGENGRKTLSTARGRGGMSTWCFHQIQVGMCAKLWDMSHLFVCFVALVIQSGAMAKFWPLHHRLQSMYGRDWEKNT